MKHSLLAIVFLASGALLAQTTVTLPQACDCVEFPSGTVHCLGGPTAVVNVTNPTTGKTWMDRNLGASQVATSSADTAAYGDLYQWGRFSDGHQCRTSATTTTLATSVAPTTGTAWYGKFIINATSPYYWTTTAQTNLWQGVNGTNNPCPSGYRIPTLAEWAAELASWSSNNAAGAFASPLKLPSGGARLFNSGSLTLVDVYGFYCSSSVSGTSSSNVYFDPSGAYTYSGSGSRAYGYSVRCLKD